MSNPNQNQNQQTQGGSKTSSTPKKKRAKKKAAVPDMQQEMAQFRKMLAMMQPVLDFHDAVDPAAEDDLRIFWDVRLIRGKDTPVNRNTGVSTLPNAMASNMRSNISSAIQREIMDKIAEPLTAVFQLDAEAEDAETMSKLAAAPMINTQEPPRIAPGDPDERAMEFAEEGDDSEARVEVEDADEPGQ